MLELKQIESFYPEYLKPFKRNILREYLQYKILETISASDFADRINFMGGTAIHIIHGNTRFSEDLDFDNVGIDKNGFEELAKIIQKRLKLEGYNVDTETSFRRAYRASIKIGDILYDNKLTGHKEEKLLIYVDTDPQQFKYVEDKVIINKFDIFTRIAVVPLDILLSQKLYAIMMRKRPMGRDFYDCIFLFGKTKPSLAYLDAKLGVKDLSGLKRLLLKRCEELDFNLLAKDVEQFLFVPADAKKILLFPELVAGIH